MSNTHYLAEVPDDFEPNDFSQFRFVTVMRSREWGVAITNDRDVALRYSCLQYNRCVFTGDGKPEWEKRFNIHHVPAAVAEMKKRGWVDKGLTARVH